MYRKRPILPKILLFVGFLALFLIFKYQDSFKKYSSFILQGFQIYLDNFFSQSGSGLKRRQPLSLVERETELKLYIGEPFRGFTHQDWRAFWNLFYGVFPEELPEKPGLPKRVSQLTTDEIAFKLMALYPQPFSFFKPSDWDSLFSIALKKK